MLAVAHHPSQRATGGDEYLPTLPLGATAPTVSG